MAYMMVFYQLSTEYFGPTLGIDSLFHEKASGTFRPFEQIFLMGIMKFACRPILIHFRIIATNDVGLIAPRGIHHPDKHIRLHRVIAVNQCHIIPLCPIQSPILGRGWP